MPDFKCVLFDCDGVLVDSETISSQVLLEMARPYGFTASLDEAKRYFHGQRLLTCFDLIEKQIGKSLPFGFELEYRRISFDRFRSEMKAIEGVEDFINQLSTPFAVASSGPVEKIRINLEVTSLFDYFENRIFSSYQINSWKPDPGIYLHAAKSMGYEPAECIVIEDSVAGVTAGIRGGFKVYALTSEGNEGELRAAGGITFNAYKELSKLLNLKGAVA